MFHTNQLLLRWQYSVSNKLVVLYNELHNVILDNYHSLEMTDYQERRDLKHVVHDIFKGNNKELYDWLVDNNILIDYKIENTRVIHNFRVKICTTMNDERLVECALRFDNKIEYVSS